MDECAMQPKANAKAKAQIIENMPLGFCGVGKTMVRLLRLRMMRVVGSCDHSDRQFAGLVLLCMYVWMDIRRKKLDRNPSIYM